MTSNVRRNLAVQLTAGGANPLVMKPKGVLPFKIGTAVNMALVAKGGTAPYAYSITGGALPTAATFTASISTATMTVTAVANGTIYIGMPVNGTGVAAGQTVVSFGTGTGGTGTYGVGISNTLTSRAMTGTLLLAAATGLITGTPSVAGAYTFTAQVQDATATVFTGSFEMPVQHLLQPVAVTPPSFDYGVINLTYQFSVSGQTGTVTYAGSGMPAGVSITAAGLLTVVYGTAGSSTVDTTLSYTVNATDSGSGDVLPIAVTHKIYKFITTNADAGPLTNPANIVIGAANTIDAAGLLSPSGFSPPYSYFADSTGTPSYCVISTSGVITATPPASTVPALAVDIAVNIRDSLGNGVRRHIKINLSAYSTLNAPPIDQTIPVSSSGIVVRKYVVASGKKLVIGAAGYFKIF